MKQYKFYKYPKFELKMNYIQQIGWAFIFIVLGLVVSCSGSGYEAEDIELNNATAGKPQNTSKGPKGDVQFKDTSFVFGNVKEGEMVQHTYHFTNIGKAPISISNCTAQCGCTTPEYSHEIIGPGKTGKIVATFNSSGRGGPKGILNEKSITVQFENCLTTEVVLKFKANVFAPEGSVSEDEIQGENDEHKH